MSFDYMSFCFKFVDNIFFHKVLYVSFSNHKLIISVTLFDMNHVLHFHMNLQVNYVGCSKKPKSPNMTTSPSTSILKSKNLQE